MRETAKRAKAALKCFRLWKCRLDIIGLDLDALEVERENADREHAGEIEQKIAELSEERRRLLAACERLRAAVESVHTAHGGQILRAMYLSSRPAGYMEIADKYSLSYVGVRRLASRAMQEVGAALTA